ncbi:MAG: O-antigen ligase family protein [Polyangiaceae bacterium]
MFAVPGIAALLVFIFLKPQEFVPFLAGLPLLYIMLGAALVGLAIDLRLGIARFDPPPQLPYAAAFVGWCLLTRLITPGGGSFASSALELIIAFILFFVVATGTASFHSFEALVGSVLAASMFVAGVCAHQGLSPLGCAVMTGSGQESLRPDGRPCQNADECLTGDAEPGASYQCERTGLFGTVSVGRGRVRYRGVLKDPNEVALTVGAAVPALIARVERKGAIMRYLTCIVGIVCVATVIVFSQSRGGILVFLTVMAVYMVRKFGVKGLVAGGILGLPLLMLGGRSGDEAEHSANERSELLRDGINLFLTNPVYGVGYDRFGEHSFLTAHNSYVLAIAENGLVGLFLYGLILYVSMKTCYLAATQYRHVAPAQVGSIWGVACLAAMAGIAVGSFFLSFTYHHVLWTYFGITGALHTAVRRHDPKFEVRLKLGEYAGVFVAAVGLIAGLRVFLKLKGL